jgi:hypothetical protein
MPHKPIAHRSPRECDATTKLMRSLQDGRLSRPVIAGDQGVEADERCVGLTHARVPIGLLRCSGEEPDEWAGSPDSAKGGPN